MQGAEGPYTQERGARIRTTTDAWTPAVPDGRWLGLHARVGEGRAPTHTPSGLDSYHLQIQHE